MYTENKQVQIQIQILKTNDALLHHSTFIPSWKKKNTNTQRPCVYNLKKSMSWRRQNIFSWPFIFSWWSRSYQRTFTISGERKLNFRSAREMSIYGKYRNTKEWIQKYRNLALFQEIENWISALWEKCQYMAAGKCKAGLVKEIFIYLDGFKCIYFPTSPVANKSRVKIAAVQNNSCKSWERLWKLRYIKKAGK